MTEDYEVGYGKPPEHTRFKKGRSGNPKGRPKGSRNFSTDLKDTLKEPVRLNKGGKRKTVSTQRAALLRLREKALSGDPRALARLIELARLYNDDDEMAEAAEKLSQPDNEVLQAYNERVLRRVKQLQPNASESAHAEAEPETDNAPDSSAASDEEDDDAWSR